MADADSLITTDPLWERACSRTRRHIRHRCQLTESLRDQARSHIDCALAKTIDPPHASIHANNAINRLLHLRHHPPQ
ncbi:hypothetical protein EGJ53_26150 [Pseudomonas fluorescens]|nr:hypothetical protein EGJ53_26150 [Pseudomonas fluorescens]